MTLRDLVTNDAGFSARYELGDLLGAGGMSEVYRGVQKALQRRVAIKFLASELLKDSEFNQRFTSEAHLASGLIHSNVVAVFDFGIAAGVPFLVTELVDGASLAAVLELRGPLPPAEVIAITDQALAGIEAIHRLGIVHRDLKPDNLLVVPGPPPIVKIADFGIAKRHLAAAGPQTSAGIAIGTPAYMAPEQVVGDPLSPATDLYALTLILYLMVVGRNPFEAATALETLQSRISRAPSIPADLHDLVKDLLARGLARRPADRFQTAAQLRTALLAIGHVVAAAGSFSAQPVAPHASREGRLPYPGQGSRWARPSEADRADREAPAPRSHHTVAGEEHLPYLSGAGAAGGQADGGEAPRSKTHPTPSPAEPGLAGDPITASPRATAPTFQVTRLRWPRDGSPGAAAPASAPPARPVRRGRMAPALGLLAAATAAALWLSPALRQATGLSRLAPAPVVPLLPIAWVDGVRARLADRPREAVQAFFGGLAQSPDPARASFTDRLAHEVDGLLLDALEALLASNPDPWPAPGPTGPPEASAAHALRSAALALREVQGPAGPSPFLEAAGLLARAGPSPGARWLHRGNVVERIATVVEVAWAQGLDRLVPGTMQLRIASLGAREAPDGRWLAQVLHSLLEPTGLGADVASPIPGPPLAPGRWPRVEGLLVGLAPRAAEQGARFARDPPTLHAWLKRLLVRELIARAGAGAAQRALGHEWDLPESVSVETLLSIEMIPRDLLERVERALGRDGTLTADRAIDAELLIALAFSLRCPFSLIERVQAGEQGGVPEAH